MQSVQGIADKRSAVLLVALMLMSSLAISALEMLAAHSQLVMRMMKVGVVGVDPRKSTMRRWQPGGGGKRRTKQEYDG